MIENQNINNTQEIPIIIPLVQSIQKVQEALFKLFNLKYNSILNKHHLLIAHNGLLVSKKQSQHFSK
jgi:hypothetical protein